MEKPVRYGLILSALVGSAAYFLGKWGPIDGILIALILGAALGQWKTAKAYAPGFGLAEKHYLGTAIGLLGLTLPANVWSELDYRWLWLALPILSHWMLTGWFTPSGPRRDAARLIGLGSGICGSAAIAAAGRVRSFDPNASALGLASINLWGSIGLILIPVALSFVPVEAEELGWLTGGSLQSIGHAVAAGSALGEEPGSWAVWFKMQRVLWLVPVLLLLSLGPNGKASGSKTGILRALPKFLWVFLGLLLLRGFHLVPEILTELAAPLPTFLITWAMVGIGSKLTWGGIKAGGAPALVWGGLLMALQLGWLLLYTFIFGHG